MHGNSPQGQEENAANERAIVAEVEEIQGMARTDPRKALLHLAGLIEQGGGDIAELVDSIMFGSKTESAAWHFERAAIEVRRG